MTLRMAWSAVAFGVTLALLSNTAMAAPSAADLLAKQRAFMGWSAGDPAVPGLKLTIAPGKLPDSTVRDAGTPTAANMLAINEEYRGLLYRQTRIVGKTQTASGFTGRVFWRSNVNANAVSLLESDAREALSSAIVRANGAALLDGVSRGSARVRDRAVEIVRVTPRDGFPIDLYIDPTTGEMLRYVIRPDDVYGNSDVAIEAYKEFSPGKRVASVLRYGTRKQTLDVTHAQIATDLPDADFTPPKPTSSWAFGTSAPIAVDEHSRRSAFGVGRSIRFKATLNGHTGTFLLDSGAGGIIVFSNFAEQLNLPTLAASGYTGVNGGFVPAREIRVSTFAIGDNILHDVIVQTSKSKEVDLDGIVGFDFLAQAIVDVDLVKKQMVILDPAKFEPNVGKGAVAFPVDLSSNTPSMPIKLPHGVIAHPFFDSGDDFFVLLSEDMRTSNKVVALSQKIIGDYDYRIVFGGVDGSAEESAPCVRITRVDVGPYGYENVPICFASPKVFGKEGGLVGFDFLQHFNWTFDYPDGKFVLSPNGR